MANRVTLLGNCGHFDIEIDQSQPISVNHAYNSLTSLGSTNDGQSNIRTLYTSDFSILMTTNNCKKLGVIPNMSIEKVKEIVNSQSVAYLENGILTYKGNLLFLNAAKEGSSIYSIEVQFVGTLKNVLNSLPLYLCGLPSFGEHLFTASAMQASFQNTNSYDGTLAPYYYSLKDTGAMEGKPFVEVRRMRPDIFAAAIYDELAKYGGFRINSKLLKTEWFRNLLVSFPFKGIVDEIVIESTQQNPFGNWDYNQSTPIPFTPLFSINDLYFLSSTLGLFQAPSTDGEIQISVKSKIILDSGSVRLRLRGGPTTAVQYTFDEFDVTQIGVNEFVLRGEIQSEWYFRIGIEALTPAGGSTAIGTEINVCFSANQPVVGLPVSANQFLGSEVKIVDYFKAMEHALNLVYFWDENNNELIIETKNDTTLPTGERVQGFLRANGNINDLTGRVNCVNTNIDFSATAKFSRNIKFAYKNDSKNELTDDNTHNGERTLSAKYEDGLTVSENPLFASVTDSFLPDPPAEQNANVLVPILHNYEIGDDPKENQDWQPILLYKVGPVYDPDGSAMWDFASVGSQLNYYPYATQQNVRLGINLAYGDAIKSDGTALKGLISIFRERELKVYNEGVTISIEIEVKVTDLLNLVDAFRDLYWIGLKETTGRYQLNSIQMNLGAKTANLVLTSFDV